MTCIGGVRRFQKRAISSTAIVVFRITQDLLVGRPDEKQPIIILQSQRDAASINVVIAPRHRGRRRRGRLAVHRIMGTEGESTAWIDVLERRKALKNRFRPTIVIMVWIPNWLGVSENLLLGELGRLGV